MDMSWHSTDPAGGCRWYLAAMHVTLEAVLSAKGPGIKMTSIQSGPAADVLVRKSLNREGVRTMAAITRSDIRGLGPGQELMSTAIEVCMATLCNTPTHSTIKQDFYPKLVQTTSAGPKHTSPEYTPHLRTWFKRSTYLWSKAGLFIVINICSLGSLWETAIGDHWVLLCIDLASRRFGYYDPLGARQGREDVYREQRVQCVANVITWLKSEHEWPWLSGDPVSATQGFAPLQGNSFDCGVFCIMAALCESHGIDLCTMPWGQQHGPAIREYLCTLLLH